MTQTLIGLFADQTDADRACTELAAVGFLRSAVYSEESGDKLGFARHIVLVEAEERDGEAKAVLLRSGAFGLDEHTPDHGTIAVVTYDDPDIREVQEQHPHGGAWLREIVFGLNDGLVTTLVFIMAVSSVSHSHRALLLVALSEVAAGGVAMALGGLLAAHTERDIIGHRIETERLEIVNEPAEERAELRAIYRRKGFSGSLLERVVAHQTSDHDRWLQAMVHDELGVVSDDAASPLRQGLQIGASFVLGGLIPTIPVLLDLPRSSLQVLAFALTGITALAVGALKAQFSRKGPLRNGLEILAIVAVGTLAGVAVGALLRGI